MAWRLSAEAGKVIKTGRNDTRRENAHCGTKSAPERGREVGGGGRKERSISKSEIIRLVFIESNDAPMTQSLGEVEHLEEIAKRLSRPVELHRPPLRWARKYRILVRLDLHTALGSQNGEWCGVALSSVSSFPLSCLSAGGYWLAHGRARTRGGEERKAEEEERRVDWGRGGEPLRESDVTCSGASLHYSRLRVGSFMQRLSAIITLWTDQLPHGVIGDANAQRMLDDSRAIVVSQPQDKDRSRSTLTHSLQPTLPASNVTCLPPCTSPSPSLASFCYGTALTATQLPPSTQHDPWHCGLRRGPFISIHSGFQGTPSWVGFLPDSDRTIFDTHPYFVFDGVPIPTSTDPLEAGEIWAKQVCSSRELTVLPF
ncbi:hypothetical protein B0H13DRAFT_2655596 [Mycena leptocephala]|nr:hypothetical protein B0H13DRAFT_2655596 [Mycena leptocephala]